MFQNTFDSISGEPPCHLKIKDNNPDLVYAQHFSNCTSVGMNSLQLNEPLFELEIRCTVELIQFSLSGISSDDCNQDVIYGPYIGGIILVELQISDTQQCHTPFISRTRINNKCKVTVEYLEVNSRSHVILQARVKYQEDKTITLCMKDVFYSCSTN